MRITCESCSGQFDLPDEKVPQRAFSIACPTCKERITVDPTAGAAPAPQPATPAAPQPAASQSPAPQPVPQGDSPATVAPAETGGGDEGGLSDTGVFTRLTPLRAADEALMRPLPPIAYIVNSGVAPNPRVTKELQRVGMEEVRSFSDVQEACDVLVENEAAILVVRIEKASAPPCEPLRPIYKLPFDIRRKTFVTLQAENVKSLDGMVAFYLQVNCLLNSNEMDAFAVRLRRALLHHLRLYRHWDVGVD